MFPMQERQLSFSSLFKKPVHNAVAAADMIDTLWIKA